MTDLATAEEFRQEIARLQAEIETLRARPCPYVTGTVTHYCTLNFAMTDAEREAVEWASTVAWGGNPHAATLRGLLERTSQSG